MNRPGFIPAVCTAAGVSLLAGTAQMAFAALLTPGNALIASIALAGGSHVALLTIRARRNSGRLVAPGLWAGATLLSLWFAPGLAAFAAFQALLGWLVRGLLCSRGCLNAALELMLGGIAFAAAAAVAARTGSLAFTIWTYLFVVAVGELLPDWRQSANPTGPGATFERFERARRQADGAIARLRPGH